MVALHIGTLQIPDTPITSADSPYNILEDTDPSHNPWPLCPSKSLITGIPRQLTCPPGVNPNILAVSEVIYGPSHLGGFTPWLRNYHTSLNICIYSIVFCVCFYLASFHASLPDRM